MKYKSKKNLKNNNSKIKKEKIEKLELMVTIVERGTSQKLITLLHQYDVSVQLVLLGKGTATSELLNYLGLAENEKDIVLSIVKEKRIPEIYKTLETYLKKKGQGISFTIPFTSVVGNTIYQFLANQQKGVKISG